MRDVTKKEIYFAGGCFWGTEKVFRSVPGVLDTTVGYANGHTEHPSYQEVCTDTTGHRETLKVVYDAGRLSLETLAEIFFMVIDPTLQNRQGNDFGSQYQTGVYYTDPGDGVLLEKIFAAKRAVIQPFFVELCPLRSFWDAEEYHQDYLEKNPAGYCHISRDEMHKVQEFIDRRLRSDIGDLAYEVVRHGATERAFTGKYDDFYEEGIYVDVVSGEPLFLSADKYNAGCGWPAFSKPVSRDALSYRRDLSHGMDRTEVRSSRGGSHLGHVFGDGPKEKGGERYCINSAALRFIPRERMEAEGYGDYIALL